MDKKKKPSAGSSLAYNLGQQEADRRAVQSAKNAKWDSLRDKRDKAEKAYKDGPKGILGIIPKDGPLQEKYADAEGDFNYYINRGSKAEVADQNRWIARGAKANALAKMKLKKKPMSEAQKKKIYGGE